MNGPIQFASIPFVHRDGKLESYIRMELVSFMVTSCFLYWGKTIVQAQVVTSRLLQGHSSRCEAYRLCLCEERRVVHYRFQSSITRRCWFHDKLYAVRKMKTFKSSAVILNATGVGWMVESLPIAESLDAPTGLNHEWLTIRHSDTAAISSNQRVNGLRCSSWSNLWCEAGKYFLQVCMEKLWQQVNSLYVTREGLPFSYWKLWD